MYTIIKMFCFSSSQQNLVVSNDWTLSTVVECTGANETVEGCEPAVTVEAVVERGEPPENVEAVVDGGEDM